MRDKVLSTLALSFALAMSATASNSAYARGGGGGGSGGPAASTPSGTAHSVSTPTGFGNPGAPHLPINYPKQKTNGNTAGNKPINCKPGGGGCMRQP